MLKQLVSLSASQLSVESSARALWHLEKLIFKMKIIKFFRCYSVTLKLPPVKFQRKDRECLTHEVFEACPDFWFLPTGENFVLEFFKSFINKQFQLPAAQLQ